jgi:hypothetical protein
VAALPERRREKSEVDRELALGGMTGTIRAEALSIEQHLQLCQMFG